MSNKIATKKLATLAIFTAIKVIILIMAMALPTMRLSVLCIASGVNGLLYRTGTKMTHVLISYIATILIGYMFMIHPSIYTIYVCFFGLYGIIHHLCMYKSLWVKQAIRWGYFVVASSICYVIMVYVLAVPIESDMMTVLYAIALVAGFAVYQYAYEVIMKLALSNAYLRRLFYEH